MSTIKADNISPVGSTLNLTAPVAGLSVAGGLTVGGIAFFSGGVTFNSTSAFSGGVTFNSTTDHAGLARFASTSTFTGLVTLTGGATSAAVISCGTAPTQGQHLANKTYVDSFTRVGSVLFGYRYGAIDWAMFTSAGFSMTDTGVNPLGISVTITPPAGQTWFVVVNFHRNDSLGQVYAYNRVSSAWTPANNQSNTDGITVWAVRVS